jgi:heme A synthase
MNKPLIYVGSGIAILFVVLHSTFQWLLDWGTELPKLNAENQAVMQVLNYMMVYVFILFAVISIYIAAKQQASTLAKMIIAFFAGTYILRIILGVVVFGLSFSEVMAWLVCAAAAACYLLALKKPAPIK